MRRSIVLSAMTIALVGLSAPVAVANPVHNGTVYTYGQCVSWDDLEPSAGETKPYTVNRNNENMPPGREDTENIASCSQVDRPLHGGVPA